MAYKKLNQQVSGDQTRSAWAKIDKTKEWADYLSNKRQKFAYDLCLRFWSPSTFGGYFVQIAVLWGHAGCLLCGVEKCPLLGGSRCTISIGRAIGGMEFVRCTEVVRLSESPLLDVSLYSYISIHTLCDATTTATLSVFE